MTYASGILRDALRTIETRAANALAHQPDDDVLCRAHLMKAMCSIADTASGTIVVRIGIDDHFNSPTGGRDGTRRKR